jgi:dihydroflavonol-4-reductase
MIAVTGASGHIGANLIRVLLEENKKVRVLVRNDRRSLSGLDVEVVDGDILDPESLRSAFYKADTVYHLAALISLDRRDEKKLSIINVKGTQNVVSACEACQVRRLVHFSTIHALSPFPAGQPIVETRPLINSTFGLFYDRTKASAERIVLKAVDSGLDAVIVNPTGIIGPYDLKPSLMGEMLISLYKGDLIALVEGGFDWVDVRDVAMGAVKAARNGKTGERYILSGTWLSVKALGDLVQKVIGCSLPRFTAPMWLARIGAPFVGTYSKLCGKKPIYSSGSLFALRHHHSVSRKKAEEELGYISRPLEETIRDTFSWFKRYGYLSS